MQEAIDEVSAEKPHWPPPFDIELGSHVPV
jgi:hypothetical protein